MQGILSDKIFTKFLMLAALVTFFPAYVCGIVSLWIAAYSIITSAIMKACLKKLNFDGIKSARRAEIFTLLLKYTSLLLIPFSLFITAQNFLSLPENHTIDRIIFDLLDIISFSDVRNPYQNFYGLLISSYSLLANFILFGLIIFSAPQLLVLKKSVSKSMAKEKGAKGGIEDEFSGILGTVQIFAAIWIAIKGTEYNEVFYANAQMLSSAQLVSWVSIFIFYPVIISFLFISAIFRFFEPLINQRGV